MNTNFLKDEMFLFYNLKSKFYPHFLVLETDDNLGGKGREDQNVTCNGIGFVFVE